MTDFQRARMVGKLGTLLLSEKNGKWIAQIAVEAPAVQTAGSQAMGVDLGLKVPAVAVTENGKTRCLGQGRANKYKKRQFRSRRRKLGKLKKMSALRKCQDKEQRWMKDQDHKNSRSVVNWAIKQQVSTIQLENLSGIRQTARTSRKNEKNLNTCSFYRLAQYLVYKAALVGIQVDFVDPRYTSQTCPACGTRNRAKNRSYACSCGFHAHRDRVGAMNIIQPPVIDGLSLSA